MRLYTGLGDDGTTDLLGARVAKDDPRIDVLGALDEATSSIGLARAQAADPKVRAALVDAQRDLYRIMAELAFTSDLRPASYALGDDRVRWLEAETDALAAGIELPAEFILPGESVPGGVLDVSRTVARRAERQVVALAHAGHDVNANILGYLNRLSSFLFISARLEDHLAGGSPLKAKQR